MEDKNSSSYMNIVKSTTILGGTQVIQMLVVILRAKFIALILGSAGMGIYSIFQSVLSTFGQIGSLGIYQSSIRDISQAIHNEDAIRRILRVFNTLVWAVGLLGFFLCLIASPFISQLLFGNTDYIWSFVFLSFAVLLFALSQGKLTILQGVRQLKLLTKTSLYTAIFSLIIAIPIYYFFGIKGIVPSIILGYLFSYILGTYSVSKIQLKAEDSISFIQDLKEGMPIVKLGAVLMINSSILTLSVLALNTVINNFGDIHQVGYNQAAFNIVNQLLIIIVSVLAADYYPRLSRIIFEKLEDVRMVVNQQLELSIIIMAPISISLIIFARYIVKLLLSDEFLIIVPMIQVMSIAFLFRCLWSIMSYVILAKGDKRTFLLFDGIIGNGATLAFNLIAFMLWGLIGIGISYAITSVLISCVVSFVVKKKYNLFLKKKNIVLFLFYTLLLGLTFVGSFFTQYWYIICFQIITLALCVTSSLFILNKRLRIFSKTM